jgi:tRNA pseudouridine13 synthase
VPAALAPLRESEYGVAGYLTPGPGLGGRLKLRYDDFHVEELGVPPEKADKGPLTAAWIRLTNWETNRFARDASGRLGISRRGVHAAGNKDKRAVTAQWFTMRAPPDRVTQAVGAMPGVQVLDAYPTRRERTLGDHAGNRFQVTVRGIELPVDEARARAQATASALSDAGGFPNFYGPQRFGTLRPTTHVVGRHIVKARFQDAIDAYVATPSPEDEPAVAAARRRYLDDRDAAAAAKALEGTGADFERALLNAVHRDPEAPQRAFAALPESLQTMFVFAYQSLLFNRILSRRIQEGLPVLGPVAGDLVAVLEDGNPRDEWLPVDAGNVARVADEAARGRLMPTGLLCGSQAPCAGGRPGQIEADVLAEEGVGPSDFVVPEAPRFSSKGSRRPLGVRAPPVAIAVAADDRVDGATKATFTFDLPKGAYATVVLREFLRLDDVRAYG